MYALVYKHTHLIFYPLLNWKPVQKVAYCDSDAVILPFAQNESCRCIEYILQWPDVSSAGAKLLGLS